MKKVLLALIVFRFFMEVSTCLAQHGEGYSKKINLRIIDSGSVFKQPPFKNCHAATIVETGRDTLLYAWFGGDHEGAKNVSIWGCYRYTNRTDQWGSLRQLAIGRDSTGASQPCWNPVLFKSAAGILYLDYKVGPNPRQWWAERKISYDNGRTWSSSQPLPLPFLGPIKNKPLQLKNGAILYPSSTESPDEKTWKVHVEIADPSGSNLRYIEIDCDSFGVIQPAILQYGNDSLQLLCRSRQNTIVQSWSFNKGKSWTPLSRVALPNPNSGIDALSLSNGWQLLVYNPMLAGKEWWAGRSVLKVALSRNGLDWKDFVTLEEQTSGEYSYPAVISDSRQIIRIAYTDNRTNIRFVDLELK
jgi:alpha-L-fucosidase